MGKNTWGEGTFLHCTHWNWANQAAALGWFVERSYASTWWIWWYRAPMLSVLAFSFPCVGIPRSEAVFSLHPVLSWVWDILHATTKHQICDNRCVIRTPPTNNSGCLHSTVFTYLINYWAKMGSINQNFKNLTLDSFKMGKNLTLVQFSKELAER